MSYTDTQVAKLQAVAPLDFDKAQDLASEFGVSARSVVSKAVSLGIDYQPKTKTTVKRTKKADLAITLRANLGVDPDSLPSLDKMTAADLMLMIKATS